MIDKSLSVGERVREVRFGWEVTVIDRSMKTDGQKDFVFVQTDNGIRMWRRSSELEPLNEKTEQKVFYMDSFKGKLKGGKSWAERARRMR